jgi:pSer/pThr/pTyr-binding forkhead associated (FHA) protein
VATLRRVLLGEVLQRYRIDQKTVVLGRDSTCDVVLVGNGISRRHCMLVLTDEGYCIEDLKSSNGTLLRGQMLTSRQLLQDGDKIVLMGHILEFTTADEKIAPAPAKQAGPQNSPTPALPTNKVDSDELKRRLNKLLGGDGLGFLNK